MNEEDIQIGYEKIKEQVKNDWVAIAMKNGFSEQQAKFLFDTCKKSLTSAFDIF